MNIYTVSDFVISALGVGIDQHFKQLTANTSGVEEQTEELIDTEPFYASVLVRRTVQSYFSAKEQAQFTFLELMLILTIREIIRDVKIEDYSRLILIIATTKGNIDVLGDAALEKQFPDRYLLPVMAEVINKYFDFPNQPMIVSNACISGVSAILAGKKLIAQGQYDHAVIVGGDLFSSFVYSGFKSFLALTNTRCKPYDKNRDGINLGEGAAGMLITNDRSISNEKNTICEVLGGGQANDANHISGPSREGLGLKISIEKALQESGLLASNIDYINAHGTATPFNDEMESIAFAAMNMEKIPLNSLKGYIGHTLGAAGVMESVLTLAQLKRGLLVKSLGYHDHGVSKELNVIRENQQTGDLTYAIKTASGFGGGNAAIIFRKL